MIRNFLIGLLTSTTVYAAPDNKIYLDQQTGNSNNVRIEQYGNSTVQGLNGRSNSILTGTGNLVSLKQGSTDRPNVKNSIELDLSGNYNLVEINQLGIATNPGKGTGSTSTTLNIMGSSNMILLQQSGDGTKKILADVIGNNNLLTAIQTDSGSHYLDINLNGPSNSASIIQKNAGSHRAAINLTNGGGPNNFNLVQQGNRSQNYSINQVCANPTGCALSVTQGQ